MVNDREQGDALIDEVMGGLSATLPFDESSPESDTLTLLDSCRVFQAVFTGPGAVFWSRMQKAANRRGGEFWI